MTLGTRKFNAYWDDQDVFAWVRRGATDDWQSGQFRPRTCFESQVMDWADDVAYSVHDVEDAIHAGWLRVDALTGAAERNEMVAIAQASFARGATDAELLAALDRIVSLPYWVGGYDGSQHSLASLKNVTSQLIGRFCTAAQNATREVFGDGRLTRYLADLVIPDEQRWEVAILKSIAVHFVMRRSGAQEAYAAQREVIQELVAAMEQMGEDAVEPWLQPAWRAAADSGDTVGVRRVVRDQVASLTDTSVLQWHERLCRR